ncbi:MAG: nucleotidyltransferase [Clostridia bacterium]|nr:nucleotidyltransferase [Clostridia bacterium]
MTVAGIVCEYNPFHNGHKFHIKETRRKTGADAIVAIMSGNLVQRGDVAVFPKEPRAKAAIEGGADLVLELPTAHSMASAEFFAKGAVKALDALGVVNFLSFGTECGNLDVLREIAEVLSNEPPEFSALLNKFSASGLSYPTARAKAVEKFLGKEKADILSSPNSLLGIEYLKALISQKSSIKPVAILRKGAGHDTQETNDGIASASYIRDLIKRGKSFSEFIPHSTNSVFENAVPHSITKLEKAILCHLIKTPAEDLRKIADVGEGLENRIKAAALSSKTLDELYDVVKTKRYTHSRIRRIILSAFLGITENDRQASPRYIKILAHNETGQKIIAVAKKTSTLPLLRNTSQVNKLGDPKIKALWERERVFDKIYEMTEI